MENQVSSTKTILNYGLYYGVASVLLSVIFYAMEIHLNPGVIGIVAAVALILAFPILAINNFKKANMNLLSWGQAVKIGMGVVVLGVLIAIIYNHIFTGFIEPDFYLQQAEITKEALIDAGMTDDQITQQMEMSSKFQGTIIGDAVGLLFFAFVGFVISAIAGAIMKRTEEDGY